MTALRAFLPACPARSGAAIRAFLLAACVVVGATPSLPAAAQSVDAIVVKMSDAALPADTTALPQALDQALRTALGVPYTQAGRTRDGAFTLRLSAPLDQDTARAALNRVRLQPGLLYANAAPRASGPATTGLPTNRVIVKYRDPAVTSTARAGKPLDAARVARLATDAGTPLAWLRGTHDGGDVLQMLQRMPIAQVEAIAARIAQAADVEYAQPDYIRTAQIVPTDPCYASASVVACSGGYQWDLFDPVGGINMPAAWNITTGSANVRVAVIDTGALVNHPDLADRFVGGYDMIADCAVANDGQPAPCTWSNQEPNMFSRDGNPADPGDWITANESAGYGISKPPYDWFVDCYVESSTWHGTHVSGTIGATPNNGIGIAGINWVSKIVPVRVLGKCGGYTSDISDAIVWAAGGAVAGEPVNANPVRVMNLSLGGGGACPPVEQSAINTALALGAVVVVSAGNSNDNADDYSPASCSGVITVAATTKTGLRARYSNYGASVDIAAPGGNADGIDPDILSTLNSGGTAPNNNGYNYVRYAGTSMAAPHVTGVASLMFSVNPALTPAQVLSKIQTSARSFPTSGPACNPTPQPSACKCTTALCGAGILDAGTAVAAALNSGSALASSSNPGSAGTPITFTMTIVGTAPTGTVKFEDGSTTLAGCGAVPLTGSGSVATATCTTTTLAAGSHAMKATYSGDSGNPASSATLTQIIIAAGATTLASSANPAFAGSSVTFTATVVGAAPTGTVQFTDNSVALAGCGAVALTGTGSVRTAACTAGALTIGSHPIAANYSGDVDNAPSSGSLTQSVVQAVPGSATIASNPYGAVGVTGATINGNTIFNFSAGATIQLGSVPGAPGSVAQIDFQSLNVGPGNSLTIRSGAPGQAVVVVNTGPTGTAIAGMFSAQGGNGAPPPVMYFKNANGISVQAAGGIAAPSGLGLDALGSTWTTGSPLVNAGTIDGGVNLDLFAARINGGGAFRGNAISLRTFGLANNPVNGAYFLQNGLQLYPGSGNEIFVTLNGYGSTPQVFNLFMNGNATVWMPSAWPAGYPVPQNNAVVAPGGSRPAGTPQPAYSGGSMILQATGSMTLHNGGTNDFVFPGAIVLKAANFLNVNGVTVDQGWTTSGQAFQGIFFESPNIVSPNGLIMVYGNDLNWMNFSTFPQQYVRAFSLKANPDTSASFVPTDSTTPHINTYSVIQNTAASGGCWACIINSQPVNMYGP